MNYKLEVYTPNKEIFDAYYYGYGVIIHQETVEIGDKTFVLTVVDYGDDTYRAEYQAGRFWSGLYHAEIKEMEPIDE